MSGDTVLVNGSVTKNLIVGLVAPSVEEDSPAGGVTQYCAEAKTFSFSRLGVVGNLEDQR